MQALLFTICFKVVIKLIIISVFVQEYEDVSITNFTTSWSDGLAFTALIHRFRPDLFDYEIVSRKPANARLEYAFRMAHKHLGIARLLDPEGG